MPRRSRLLAGLQALLIALVVLAAAPPAAATTDEHRALQWGLDQIRAEEAWGLSRGAGQVIAIVDSGIDLGHPDLAGKVIDGRTFVDCRTAEGAIPIDGCGSGDWLEGRGDAAREAASGHGTHVAGIAAAVTGNGSGIAGVAPEARLLSVKALDQRGGLTEDVGAGIRWATRNGATVINLSLALVPGGQALAITGQLREVTDAVREALAAGVVVIAAAGNNFASVCAEPAFDPQVVCVVATDPLEQPASYSNRAVDPGLNVVAAPGGMALTCADDVLSTWPRGNEGPCASALGTPGYASIPGTSMAAPHVAGVAALLLAQGRSAQETVRVLRSTARHPLFGVRGFYTPTHGYGIVDAAAAVRVPAPRVVERLAGGDRVATAAAVSARVFSTARMVVVARADEYADALAGAPLAAHLEGPLLLSASHALSRPTADEVRRLGADRAVLLGGSAALSAQVEQDLRELGVEVQRVAGANRFETAARVAGQLPAFDEVLVTEGANADRSRGWPDALSASGLAAAQRLPVLLVTRDQLPASTAAVLGADVDVTIVGGTGAVSEPVAAAIDRRAGAVRRIAGSTRYDTSARVAGEAERRGVTVATTWIATGRDFADGLVAGAAAGSSGGVLLLVDGHDLDGSPPSAAFLREHREAIRSARLVGGRGAISERAEGQIADALR